jgi:hypothetical protein
MKEAPSETRETEDPTTDGRVSLLPWAATAATDEPGIPDITLVPAASCDPVRMCKLGEADLKISWPPGIADASGNTVVRTPCDAVRV